MSLSAGLIYCLKGWVGRGACLKRFRVGLTLVLVCTSLLCLRYPVGALQEIGRSADVQPAIQTPPSSPDFEVKIGDRKFLVRRKGSQDWKDGFKFKEPVEVGLLDGNQKIYLVSKVIKPPIAKHRVDPDYPQGRRGPSTKGQTIMHIVVDDQGTVRFPTVDVSGDAQFTKAAVDAVKRWTFEPAKLNGQPIAVLIFVTINFTTY
jgi:TonB family protein